MRCDAWFIFFKISSLARLHPAKNIPTSARFWQQCQNATCFVAAGTPDSQLADRSTVAVLLLLKYGIVGGWKCSVRVRFPSRWLFLSVHNSSRELRKRRIRGCTGMWESPRGHGVPAELSRAVQGSCQKGIPWTDYYYSSYPMLSQVSPWVSIWPYWTRISKDT